MRQITFDARAIDLASLKRAAYKFTNVCSVEFQLSDEQVVCVLSFKNAISDVEFSEFSIEFRNEVLDDELRAEISAKTEPIRNLILAHAFSKASLSEDV